MTMRDMRRPPVGRDPERCDPADPRPCAAFVPRTSELTVDERIRAVVASMVAGYTPAPVAVDAEDLVVLQELDDLEVEPVTEAQLQAMAPEVRDRDLDGFIASLTDAERAQLRELVAVVEEAPQEPPDGAGGGGGAPA